MTKRPIGSVLEVRSSYKVLVDFGRWQQECDPYFDFSLPKEDDPMTDENPNPTNNDGLDPELLSGLRAKRAAGDELKTQFDNFWEKMMPRLVAQVKEQLGVTDEDRIKNLLRFGEGIARMTWASQLQLISANLSRSAELELAVIQVNTEAALTKKESTEELPTEEPSEG